MADGNHCGKRLSFRLRIVTTIIAASLAMNSSGCQGDPRGWYYTTKKPSEAAVVGEYALAPNNWENDSNWVLECIVEGHNQAKTGLDVMLMKNDPPYSLHFVVGDPDSGEGFSYFRKSK